MGPPEAVGPVIEIGRGESLGVAWRYSVYESTMGVCVRLELAAGGEGVSCGGGLGVDQARGAISLMGVGSGTGTPSQVEGFATDEVAAVWIETNGGRVPATLMSLGPAGLDGQIFLALIPGDRMMEAAVAIDAEGNELGRSAIDGP